MKHQGVKVRSSLQLVGTSERSYFATGNYDTVLYNHVMLPSPVSQSPNLPTSSWGFSSHQPQACSSASVGFPNLLPKTDFSALTVPVLDTSLSVQWYTPAASPLFKDGCLNTVCLHQIKVPLVKCSSSGIRYRKCHIVFAPTDNNINRVGKQNLLLALMFFLPQVQQTAAELSFPFPSPLWCSTYGGFIQRRLSRGL